MNHQQNESDENKKLMEPSISNDNNITTNKEEQQSEPVFLLPSADGSPPKIMTLNQVTDVIKNIENMTLVHEIAINPEFKLQPYEPPENSLEKRIKDVVHKAFWDVLKEQLNADPPCFDHAIQLLIEIKECFPQIIPSYNQRVLLHINEVLDPELIKQQAEQKTLDFKSYADFVIQLMAKSCAPARDEQIELLKKVEDVVDMFKGILEVMSVMKLDMANCLLEFARNDILATSVEYEKEKFKEYLEYYKFGFPVTENWLKRNQIFDNNGQKSTSEQTIFSAFLELMDLNNDAEFPEIMSADKDRLYKLSLRAIKLCVCSSVVAITSAIPIFSNNTDYRNSLALEIMILLENVNDRKDIGTVIENIWIQVLAAMKARCEENKYQFNQDTENTIKTQILRAIDKQSPVYNLMWKRLQTYIRLTLKINTGLPPPPPGYQELKNELEKYAITFKRLCTYNYSVFGEYYSNILNERAIA